MDELTSKELIEDLYQPNQPVILDIRSREAFEKWHIEGKAVLNVPYFEWLQEETQLHSKFCKSDKIYVVCGEGNTSKIVAASLKKLGYQAFNLKGGMEAWSSHYTITQINQHIYQICRVAKGCISYLIASGGQAIIIDPLNNGEIYLDFIQKLNVTVSLILDTHGHADHISGGADLSKRLGAPYYLHPYDAIHPIDLRPATISYHPLWEGQILNVGDLPLQIIHIPGHTLGNTAVYLNSKYLFAGDSIFLGSISRPDLGNRAHHWSALHYHSLRKLLELPDDTLVFPGHISRLDESNEQRLFCRSLGELKRTNKDLVEAGKSIGEFTAYILNNLSYAPKETYSEIKRVNLGLSHPCNEELAALETGKNCCSIKSL